MATGQAKITGTITKDDSDWKDVPSGASGADDDWHDVTPTQTSQPAKKKGTFFSGFMSTSPLALPGMAKRYLWDIPSEEYGKAVESFNKGDYAMGAGHSIAMTPGAGIFSDVLEGQMGEGQKAAELYKTGHPVLGTVHEVLGAVPMLGPMSSQVSEHLLDPETRSQGYGELAGLATSELGAKALHAGVKAAGTDFFKVNPTIAALKAWGVRPSLDTFQRDLPGTLGFIRETYGKNIKIKTNKQAIAAARRADSALADGFQEWMKQGRHNRAVVSGDEIVRATENAIPSDIKLEKPELAKKIVDNVRKAYGGKWFDIDKINDLRSNKTKRLDSFYDKTTGQRIAAKAHTTEAVLKAQRDALAEALYRALDPTNNGEGPRKIGQMRSHVIDIMDAALRRENMATASKPVSKFSAVAGAIPKAAQAVVSSPGLGYVKGADILNPETLWGGNVDPWVRKAFEAAPENTFQIPKPYPLTPYRLGLPPATPALGPMMTPTPAGPPPYMGRGISPSIGTRTLGPATQIQQPGFAVEDMVPVTDSATGRITYVPRWYEPGQIPASETVRGPQRPPYEAPEQRFRPAVRGTYARDPFGKKITKKQERAIEGLRNPKARILKKKRPKKTPPSS